MPPQVRNDEVVLVMEAGTDAGCRQAHALLQAGCRVAVADRCANGLTRIIHGYSSSQVLAIAADTSDAAQLQRLIDTVQRRFAHPIDRIVHADRELHRLTLVS